MTAVNCGNADAGDHAGRADGAGADADLDRIDADADQRLGGLGGRDVARHHLGVVGQAANPLDLFHHLGRMAVGGIDHQHVNLGVEQSLGAGEAIVAGAGRGGGAQAALVVLAGVGVELRLLDVLDGDEADAAVGVIDHQQLFDAVLVEQALGFRLVHAFAHRDQALGGHQFRNRLLLVGSESHVAVGQDADQLAGRLLDHRDAGDAVIRHQAQRVGQTGRRFDGDGIDHHAQLEPLDAADFVGLPLDIHVAVKHADTAGLSHRNGEGALGHRVHGGGHQRNPKLDRLGQPGARVGLRRQDRGFGRHQQDVVEG